jgi:KaiC/GvpD/RAD55 family RecA-like ATPase
MRFLVGNSELSKLLMDKIGNGKLILFKFGHGSGGDLLMKQFFEDIPEGSYSVWISTHQSEVEMIENLNDLGMSRMPEVISLLPYIENRLSEVEKRDKFINEGIMVTDLLEISSYSEDRMIDKKSHMRMLAAITSTSMKQILPFRMVVDSIVDLVMDSTREDVIDRLMVLKKALREKGGLALIGCPMEFTDLRDQEQTLFDAVIEVTAEKRNDMWSRTMVLKNIKGSGEPPIELEVESIGDIPSALSVD